MRKRSNLTAAQRSRRRIDQVHQTAKLFELLPRGPNDLASFSHTADPVQQRRLGKMRVLYRLLWREKLRRLRCFSNLGIVRYQCHLGRL